MTVFRYVAYDAAGGKHSGLVEGDSPADARERLRTRELFPSKVAPSGEEPGRRPWVQRLRAVFRRDRSAELALPLRELSTLLSAGVPLVQSLGALAGQAEDSGVENVLRGLREQVLRGASLSAATASYPQYFGPVAQNMIAAGEETGNLEAALRGLSEQLLRRRELVGKVSAALIYPALLLLVSLGVVAFLLSYVVPRISQVYAERGASLPVPTRMLLGMSGLFRSYWAVVPIGAVLGGILAGAGLRHKRIAMAWHRAKLRSPIIGPVLKKQCVAQFSGTLCALLKAGVPLVEALRITAGTLRNGLAAEEVRRVADEVEAGGEVSSAIRGNKVFPETVAEMMAAGEESGELVGLLETLGTEYERQVQASAERACRVLEPLVVILMGGAVLFIVLSVLLPIVRMSQLVRL